MPAICRESTAVLRAAFAIALVASLVVVVPVHAQTAPTLTGETLTGTTTSAETKGDCRTDEYVSLTYTVSGTATGPYAGPFSEAGTLTVQFFGPPEARIGTEPDKGPGLDATFEVDSSAGQVTGDKGPISGRANFVLCTSTGDLAFPAGFGIAAVYVARIETADGVFVDRGIASGPWLSSGDQVTITETFASSFAAPLASREQCKDVGSFFRNHGQCVSAFK